MGKLTRSQVVEAALWFAIVAIFYAFSFGFDRPIEIYKFGATGWPRVVLFLLLLAAIGNLAYTWRHGSAAQKGRVGIADDVPATTVRSPRQLLRMGGVLATPFAFALLLKPVGFYFASPFFIAAIILLFGERRIKYILVITGFIYLLLLGLFVVLLNAPLPQGNVSPFYDYSAFILTLNSKLQQMW
ncbi:MAG: tripartite tricarboxylate transporter TctB family protein [Pseudomonadota bacterium]